TVACARCHDHKFDPIPTADYYGLAGILHSTAVNETVIDAGQPAQTAIAGAAPAREVFEGFSGADYGGRRRAGPAVGDGPADGIASSSQGRNGTMGSLTSRKFRMPKLYVHVRLAGSKGDPRLSDRSPLRLTLVADGHKSQHITTDGSGEFRWRTMRMTKEIGRLCYFEIVDRSEDGYIAVDKIVISDSPKPREDEGAAPSLRPATSQRPAASTFAAIAMDEDPRDVRIHIRGNHQNLGEPASRRFLQVISGEDQQPIREGSGRLQLAE